MGRAVWRRRLLETLAILLVGDAVLELLRPREHSLLWEAGPAPARRATRFFADRPHLMRLLGSAQLALGLWLALRQYRRNPRDA